MNRNKKEGRLMLNENSPTENQSTKPVLLDASGYIQGNPEQYSHNGSRVGWKLHLNIQDPNPQSPLNQQVLAFLDSHRQDFFKAKLGAGGDFTDGSGMTIYIGSREDAERFTAEFEKYCQEKNIKLPVANTSSDMPIGKTGIVSTRFDATLGGLPVNKYGAYGTELLSEDKETISKARSAQEAKPAYRNSFETIELAYGKYFTGTADGSVPDWAKWVYDPTCDKPTWHDDYKGGKPFQEYHPSDAKLDPSHASRHDNLYEKHQRGIQSVIDLANKAKEAGAKEGPVKSALDNLTKIQDAMSRARAGDNTPVDPHLFDDYGKMSLVYGDLGIPDDALSRAIEKTTKQKLTEIQAALSNNAYAAESASKSMRPVTASNAADAANPQQDKAKPATSADEAEKPIPQKTLSLTEANEAAAGTLIEQKKPAKAITTDTPNLSPPQPEKPPIPTSEQVRTIDDAKRMVQQSSLSPVEQRRIQDTLGKMLNNIDALQDGKTPPHVIPTVEMAKLATTLERAKDDAFFDQEKDRIGKLQKDLLNLHKQASDARKAPAPEAPKPAPAEAAKPASQNTASIVDANDAAASMPRRKPTPPTFGGAHGMDGNRHMPDGTVIPQRGADGKTLDEVRWEQDQARKEAAHPSPASPDPDALIRSAVNSPGLPQNTNASFNRNYAEAKNIASPELMRFVETSDLRTEALFVRTYTDAVKAQEALWLEEMRGLTPEEQAKNIEAYHKAGDYYKVPRAALEEFHRQAVQQPEEFSKRLDAFEKEASAQAVVDKAQRERLADIEKEYKARGRNTYGQFTATKPDGKTIVFLDRQMHGKTDLVPVEIDLQKYLADKNEQLTIGKLPPPSASTSPLGQAWEDIKQYARDVRNPPSEYQLEERERNARVDRQVNHAGEVQMPYAHPGGVVDGQHRLRALEAAGVKTVWVMTSPESYDDFVSKYGVTVQKAAPGKAQPVDPVKISGAEKTTVAPQQAEPSTRTTPAAETTTKPVIDTTGRPSAQTSNSSPQKNPGAQDGGDRSTKGLGAAGLASRGAALREDNAPIHVKALNAAAIAADTADMIKGGSTFSKLGVAGNALGFAADTLKGYHEEGISGAAREGAKSAVSTGAGIALFTDASRAMTGGKAVGGVAGFAGKAGLLAGLKTATDDAIDYSTGKKQLTYDNATETSANTVVNMDPLKAITGLAGGATKLVGVDTGIQHVSLSSAIDKGLGQVGLTEGKGDHVGDVIKQINATYAAEQTRWKAGELAPDLRAPKEQGAPPAMTDYRHLAAIRGHIKNHIPGGKIDGHDIMTDFSKIDMTKPENYLAYKAGMNRAMAAESKIMEENRGSTYVPRWLKSGERAEKFNNAESQYNMLGAAEKEFQMFEDKMRGYKAKQKETEKQAQAQAEKAKAADFHKEVLDTAKKFNFNLDRDGDGRLTEHDRTEINTHFEKELGKEKGAKAADYFVNKVVNSEGAVSSRGGSRIEFNEQPVGTNAPQPKQPGADRATPPAATVDDKMQSLMAALKQVPGLKEGVDRIAGSLQTSNVGKTSNITHKTGENFQVVGGAVGIAPKTNKGVC